MALQYSPTHTIVWGTLKDIWGWRSQEARARHGRPDGQGGLRNLHEPLRMPGRLPEGYHRGLHRKMNREYLGATVTYAEKVYGKD